MVTILGPELRQVFGRPTSLADPYLKTARAKVHLEQLRSALQSFYETKPCRFSREDDLESGLHIIRMKIVDTPDEVTLIAGDFFYNLRASLDHLVWCLAKSNGVPYPTNTQFPIIEVFDKGSAKRFKRRTKGVPAAAVTIIESLQPYKAGEATDTLRIRSHWLWQLDKLCNISKHMRLPVHGSTGMVTWPNLGPPLVSFDDDAVMRLPLSRKNEVSTDPNVTFDVVFGDLYWGVACDFQTIERMYEYVANTVIPKFAGFFK